MTQIVDAASVCDIYVKLFYCFQSLIKYKDK
jgi:hypothetical protein